MIKKLLVGIVFVVTNIHAGTINIAVAANVSYAMDELKAKFNEMNPNTKVEVTLGSSGKLTAQIENGAPYQVFMSANMGFPQALYDEKIAITKPIVYAQGSLAMLSAKKQNFSQGMNFLGDKSINKIAIANPKTAPYGTAAVEAMKNGHILGDVESKFVYAESISQAVIYALTAADVGFIAKSSLYDPKMKQYKEGIHWVEVDTKLYKPINQGIVLLKNGTNNKEAKAFYDFMLSNDAKKIMKQFGYLVR